MAQINTPAPPGSPRLPVSVLEPLAPGSPSLEAALTVYIQCWDLRPDTSRAFFERYATSAGFAGWLAKVEDQPAGMIIVADFKPGSWWCDRVAARLGWQHPALADAAVVVELAVSAAVRRTGLGTQLHDVARHSSPRRRLVLSTRSDNVVARAFYAKHGWRTLGEMTFSPGAAPHLILARECRP